MKKCLVFSTMFLLLVTACISQDPKEVNLHSDECSYCKMVISDQQFASQLVSDKGKSYPFDSIECMAAYAYQKPEIAENSMIYVADYTQQSQWLLIDNADIYNAESIQSPMGLSLLALPRQETIPLDIADSEKLNWDETIILVVEQWDVTK